MATYMCKAELTDGTTIPVGSALYGTCSTAASTAAKVVTMANFDKLITGVTIHVKFTNTNTAANPTLNVNSTGAKAIYKYGTTRPGAEAKTSWNEGAVISFTYDGTSWQMNDWLNNDTTYDVMTSSELTTGTAETSRVVTAKNLKTGVNSLIDTKINALDVDAKVAKAGDTMTGDLNMNAKSIIYKSTDLDSKGTVSTDKVGNSRVKFTDNNSNIVGMMSVSQSTNGTIWSQLKAYNQIPDDNDPPNYTQTSNIINVGVKKDGSAVYSVTDKEAFRTAIDCPQNKYLTNQDLNDLTVPGFYNATTSNTCANKPTGTSAFGLIVIHSASGNFYKQYFFPSETNSKPYFRSGNNGTWTAWEQQDFAMSSDLDNYLSNNASVSITGAVNGSGTFSDGTATIAVNRRACNVGNTTSTATTDTPWYLVADYTVPNSSDAIRRITFLVQTGQGNTDSRINDVGILDVVVRINSSGTIGTLKANWILSGYSINTDDCVLTYDNTSRKVSLYVKRTESYSTYRFIVLAESSNYNNVDTAELWTLYNTRTGIVALPTGENITIATSTLATLETGTVYMNSPAIDRTDAAPETEQVGTGRIIFRDKNNKQIGMIQPSRLTDGRERLYITVNSEKNNSFITNYLILDIAPDGTCSYRVSDPAAFRAAISAAAESHNQASNTINAMTGYSKPSTTSAIATSDTLNQAIGKLETALDSKADSVDLSDYLPLTGGIMSGDITTQGNISLYNNKNIELYPDSNHLSGITGAGSSSILFNHDGTEVTLGASNTINKCLFATENGLYYGAESSDNEISRKADINKLLDILSISTYIVPDGTTNINSADHTKIFYYLPDSVTSIGNSAFENDTTLMGIKLSNNLMDIGAYAFENCTGLINITIPNTVSVIDMATFQGCTSLKTINIWSENLTEIRNYAFKNCSSLTRIEIDKNVTTIGTDAFAGCTNLTDIIINKPQNSIAGAPWGSNARISWLG